MVEIKKIPIITILGPTASGKTGLSIEVAKKYNGEIISADSMQVYDGMKIATATPTEKEKQKIPHHLMSFLSPEKTFSVADYVDLAQKAADDIHSRKKTPILVGGTGLYIDSFLNNTLFADIIIDEERKKELEKYARKNGGKKLLEILHESDRELAEKLHENQHDRIIRGILVSEFSNKNLTEHKKLSQLKPSPYISVIIGLNYKNRENLYEKINQRVDEMVENGIIEEARIYYEKTLSQTAKEAIGHKELKGYLTGKNSKDEAIENLKMKTRRYAKRQLTWFRKNNKINWIYIDEHESLKDISKTAFDIIDKSKVLKW